MEKLSIREASERFGLSRARIYKMLNDGIVNGHQSGTNAGGSWVNLASLQMHIEERGEKWERGRPRILAEENEYISVRDAAQKSGYSTQHIYLLIKQGSIASRRGKKGILIHYPDLLRYKK